MSISSLALAAKKVIDAAWQRGPSYDLSSQAAYALESAQLLQLPETAAESEHYRAAFEAQQARAETLDRLLRTAQDRVAELEQCQKNQADNFEVQAALIRQAEARVAELETDLAAKVQDAEAAVNGWGRARDRVAELEAELRIGTPWTCPTCSKENRRDVCVICETDRPDAEEDCDHPNGYGPNGCAGCGAFRPTDDEDGCPRNVIDGDVGAHLFRKGALSDSPIACSYCGAEKPESGDAR